MAQTVIGMFESSSKAQDAVEELIDAGISRDRIDVSASNNSGSSYSSNETRNDNDDNESGISKFFKSLFGDNDDDADKYTRVASRTQSMITVHAQSGDEAERVADILDDNGAVDVDEHAATTGYSRTGNNAGSGSENLSNTGSSDYTNSSLATDTTLGLASGTGGTTGFESTTGTTGYAGGGNTGNADLIEGTTGTTGFSDAGFTNTNTDEESRKIPIIEESLEVGKREVKTGGVRLRSRIIERPVEESVRLREERVNVERNTVDRAATDADFKNFQERDIEMVERAEVPVVNKEARVVEEVSIAKDVEERNETIKDTVRKTEVDVENLEQTDVKDRYSNKD